MCPKYKSQSPSACAELEDREFAPIENQREMPGCWEEVKPRFELFSSNDREAGCLLASTKETLRPTSLSLDQHCHSIKQGDIKRVVILFHGFMSSINAWASEMKDTILTHEPWAAGVAVLLVDWREGAGPGLLKTDYPKAAANARYVGSATQVVLRKLSQLGKIETHCIGHSVGAHVCGFLGQALKEVGLQLDRITGLDPAGPEFLWPWSVIPGDLQQFENLNPDWRLDNTDAKHVDVIHTDGEGLGTMHPLGDTDFYIGEDLTSLGAEQGCCWPVNCDHSAATDYMLKSISDTHLSYLSPAVLNCSRPSGQTLAGCEPLAHINSPFPGYHFNGSFPGLFGVHKTEREPSVGKSIVTFCRNDLLLSGLNAEDCSAALSVVSGVGSACSKIGDFLCPFTGGIGCVASKVCGGVSAAADLGGSVCGVCSEAGGTGDLASLVRQQGQAQLFSNQAILDGQAEILNAVQKGNNLLLHIRNRVDGMAQDLKDLLNSVIYAKFLTGWTDVQYNFKRLSYTKDGMVVRNQQSKEFMEAALTGQGIGGYKLQTIINNIFRMLLGKSHLHQDDNLFKVNKENCKFITDFKEMLHDCLQMEMVARKMADHEVTEHFIEEFKKKIVSVEEAWVTECGCESLGGDWGEAIHHIGKVIHNKVSCSAQAPRRRVDTCAECGQQGWAACGGDCVREDSRCVRRNDRSRCKAGTQGIEYQGDKIGDFIVDITSSKACSEECVRNSKCLSWTWWEKANICSLKGSVTGERRDASATSGICEEALPPQGIEPHSHFYIFIHSCSVPRSALEETDEGCWGDGWVGILTECCSDIEPCGIGEGDCSSDSQCEGALVCGSANCIGSNFWSTNDCCEPG